MNDIDKKTEKLLSEFNYKAKKQVLASLFVAGISIINPYYGLGMLTATEVKKYFTNSKVSEVQFNFLKEVLQQLEDKIDSLDEEVVKSSEFQYLLEECLEKIKFEKNKLKKQFFLNQLLKKAFNINQDKNLESHYISILEGLTDSELILLDFFDNTKEYIDQIWGDVNLERQSGGEVKIICDILKINNSYLKLLMEQLYSKGLISTQYQSFNVMKTTTTYQTLIQNHFTQFGKDFLYYCRFS